MSWFQQVPPWTCQPHTARGIRPATRCTKERRTTHQSPHREGTDFSERQPKPECFRVGRFSVRLLEGGFRITCFPVFVVYNERGINVHAKGISEIISVGVENTYSSSLRAHERPTSTDPSRSNPTRVHKTRFHSSSLGFGFSSYSFFRWMPTS